jgi:NAD(P)H-dependent FMN reductase
VDQLVELHAGEPGRLAGVAATPSGKRLLVLVHSRTGSTAALADAAVAGGREAGAPEVEVRLVDVAAAGLDDVLGADAVLFATPARFGALAGLTKDLLERVYPWFEEVPDVRPGMPWTVIAKGASDPTGAVRDLERILTGLRWRQVLPPLVVTGDATDDDLAAAAELGGTLAAGIDVGIW